MKNPILKIGMFFLLVLVTQLLFDVFNVGTDDSDNGGLHRSGVSIVTDHRTGLQYIKTWSGGITPRLGPDGKQIGESK